MTDTTALWAAVDTLVEPQHIRIDRESQDATDALIAEWDAVQAEYRRLNRRSCVVAAYRASLAAHESALQAATARHAVVPSLWDQSTTAVGGKGDSDGARGSSPARERSIADWDLMEHRQVIKESTRLFTVEYGDPKKPLTEPFMARTEIRHLASLMLSKEHPDKLPFLIYRVQTWARVMARLLNQLDAPKPFRPRKPCAACGVGVRCVPNPEQPGETIMQWPVIVSLRGGECEQCGAWWWPGELADAYMEAA